VPLGDLYEGCRQSIAARGGRIALRSGAREVRVCEGKFAGLVLEDGSEITADALIAAVPHTVLPGLLPKELSASGGMLEGLQNIHTSPITGVHLWFDRTVMAEPFLTLLDHTTQWVFNKTLLYGEPAGRGQYLQLVISASYDLVPKSRQEIIDLCRRELAEILPASREAQVEKATVVKEVSATFSPRPDVDKWRPAQKTAVDNLYLAGDWTRTGWPSTMEGAVRSGYLAAEAVLAGFRQPRSFLQPDLSFEGFSKMRAERVRSRA
jgi:uncharacterized protein with NAD-binding domain and iron-sulfur cluster